MMSARPVVSVVIPTYNREGVICRTIDNIFDQTYRNIEVIIVDDGSTDNTHAKLQRYGNQVRLLSQPNLGPAIARNNGARAARGEIIAFQDSDDLWQPTKLERQVALMDLDPSVVCCLCGVLLKTVNGVPFTSFDHSLVHFERSEGIWLNPFDVLATRFILFNQAVAIRRHVFDKLGGFPENLRYLEDYDLPLRLAVEGPWAFIREPLVIYGEGSPLSFSAEAKRDPVLLTKCEIAVYNRVLAYVAKEQRYSSARRNLKKRLRAASRKLGRLQTETRHVYSRIAGMLWAQADRYRVAAFRRSPWFPQPITTSPSKLEFETSDSNR